MVVEEIWSNTRDAAICRDRGPGVTFLKKTRFLIWSREVCVQSLRSLSFFVWLRRQGQIDTQTDKDTSKYRNPKPGSDGFERR